MEDWAESDDEEMSDEGEDADEKPKDKKSKMRIYNKLVTLIITFLEICRRCYRQRKESAP